MRAGAIFAKISSGRSASQRHTLINESIDAQLPGGHDASTKPKIIG
jgi:hypothetical protein